MISLSFNSNSLHQVWSRSQSSDSSKRPCIRVTANYCMSRTLRQGEIADVCKLRTHVHTSIGGLKGMTIALCLSTLSATSMKLLAIITTLCQYLKVLQAVRPSPQCLPYASQTSWGIDATRKTRRSEMVTCHSRPLIRDLRWEESQAQSSMQPTMPISNSVISIAIRKSRSK